MEVKKNVYDAHMYSECPRKGVILDHYKEEIVFESRVTPNPSLYKVIDLLFITLKTLIFAHELNPHFQLLSAMYHLLIFAPWQQTL